MEARKISTHALLNVISYLFENGVLFVDLELEVGEETDSDGVNVIFKKEYMHPTMVDNFENINGTLEKNNQEPNDIEITKLKDEDLENLI
jgi:hypothetical protein